MGPNMGSMLEAQIFICLLFSTLVAILWGIHIIISALVLLGNGHILDRDRIMHLLQQDVDKGGTCVVCAMCGFRNVYPNDAELLNIQSQWSGSVEQDVSALIHWVQTKQKKSFIWRILELSVLQLEEDLSPSQQLAHFYIGM